MSDFNDKWCSNSCMYFIMKKDRHLTSQAHSSHSTFLFFCIKIILYPNYYIVIFCIGKKHHFNMVTFCSHLLGVSVSRFWKNKRNDWVLAFEFSALLIYDATSKQWKNAGTHDLKGKQRSWIIKALSYTRGGQMIQGNSRNSWSHRERWLRKLQEGN